MDCAHRGGNAQTYGKANKQHCPAEQQGGIALRLLVLFDQMPNHKLDLDRRQRTRRMRTGLLQLLDHNRPQVAHVTLQVRNGLGIPGLRLGHLADRLALGGNRAHLPMQHVEGPDQRLDAPRHHIAGLTISRGRRCGRPRTTAGSGLSLQRL